MENKIKFVEKWVRPKDKEKMAINTLIDRDDTLSVWGPVHQAFEKCFRAYIGARYCLTFSHGTNALMAAYYAAGIGPGDEVISPGVGYIASYAGAMHMGARPIFCDVDPDTLLIDVESARKKITNRTKAINIIHLNGRVCDLDAVMDLSKEYGLAIIDDAAHATGAEWGGVKIGNFNHVTCFSLQGINPNGKPVSGGEGGVACTNDRAAYQRMLAYCHLHRYNVVGELRDSPYSDLDFEVLGLKWRAHPLALALAYVSLGTLDYRNAKMHECYSQTAEILKEFDFIKVPTIPVKGKMGGFHMGIKLIYDPQKLGGATCSALVEHLKEAGISAKGPYYGYYEYKRSIFAKGFDLWGRDRGPIGDPWAGLEKFQVCKPEDFPVAESLKDRVFTLPAFIEVDPEYYVALKIALERFRSTKGSGQT